MSIYLVRTISKETGKEYFFFADLIGVCDGVLIATYRDVAYALPDQKLIKCKLMDNVYALSVTFNREYLSKMEAQNVRQ